MINFSQMHQHLLGVLIGNYYLDMNWGLLFGYKLGTIIYLYVIQAALPVIHSNL